MLCQCPSPGYCPRHGCVKTPHWHELCRTRPDYFRLWEEGCGPGQGPPPAPRPACRHRGGERREEQCPTCRGQVRVKVFACAVRGECTLARALAGATCCATCPDYEPVPAGTDGAPETEGPPCHAGPGLVP